MTYSRYGHGYGDDSAISEESAQILRGAAERSAECVAQHFAQVGFAGVECGGTTHAIYPLEYATGAADLGDKAGDMEVEEK